MRVCNAISNITYLNKRESLIYNSDNELINIGSFNIIRDNRSGFIKSISDEIFAIRIFNWYKASKEIEQAIDNTPTPPPPIEDFEERCQANADYYTEHRRKLLGNTEHIRKGAKSLSPPPYHIPGLIGRIMNFAIGLMK